MSPRRLALSALLALTLACAIAPAASASPWRRSPTAERSMRPLLRILAREGIRPTAGTARCVEQKRGDEVRCSVHSAYYGKRLVWAGYTYRTSLAECSNIVFDDYGFRSVVRAGGRRVACLDMGPLFRLA